MRKSLVRRGAAAALAVFTGLTTLALGASPARADVKLAGVTLSTGTVVLDGDAGCANRVKVTFKVYDPQGDEDEVLSLSADVTGPDGDIVDFLFPSQASRSGDYAYFTDWVFLCGNIYAPGAYRVQTELKWWDENYDDYVVERVDRFSVKRPTSLTYDATPEPVKKNSALTHRGVLKADPVSYGAKKGLKGAVLKFYFKANGTAAYVYKGQTVTGTGGKYSKKIKATKSGTWKVVYAGSGARQPQTKYDAVKVK
ncbi:hypothetical protein [Actinoplanes derwentensis]|uniref:Calcium-binding protein n=1 Tax=Actinoplanes derwentensis TaxID=113562 RepID=A0A1H2CQJ0_9ACTN|nr:hypothetical protein [Actinoplanes derwentensis]GID83904.1 hypothetical protein Ade03nite_28280 [Actinoplanes derwentensis]SDT72336.1 hypothetical protein SAMN04489716_6384 [Actinoplanes derwentensis]